MGYRVNLRSDNEIIACETFGGMSGEKNLHIPPAEADIRVVTLTLGDLANRSDKGFREHIVFEFPSFFNVVTIYGPTRYGGKMGADFLCIQLADTAFAWFTFCLRKIHHSLLLPYGKDNAKTNSMQNKPTLAFDCATPTATVAFMKDGHIDRREIAHGRQAAELVATIDALLQAHDVSYADIGTLMTTVGPGSFTGLRIALATLRGLVLAHETPVKRLTSLEAMAWDVVLRGESLQHFCIAIHAGKGEVFSQRFAIKNKTPVATEEILLCLPSQLPTDFSVFGNMNPNHHFIPGPDAAVLCQIAEQLPAATLSEMVPFYIRPPDAKFPQPFPWLPKDAS